MQLINFRCIFLSGTKKELGGVSVCCVCLVRVSEWERDWGGKKEMTDKVTQRERESVYEYVCDR